jgi:predicted MPP superfamily phosphohydrolase
MVSFNALQYTFTNNPSYVGNSRAGRKKETMKHKTLIIIFITGVLIILFLLWQNNSIVSTEYLYKTSKISSHFDGYKIAQVSDLHNKEFGKNQRRLIAKLRKANPDIIVLTGDQIDSRKTKIDIAFEFVQEALKIAPVYYISGNHEAWLSTKDWDKLMGGLMPLGATPMDNRVIEITKAGEFGFYLLGLSDSHLSDYTLTNQNSNLPGDRLQILLAHEPQYLENYSLGGVDLVLSGHAHGGQFRIPGLGGLVAPGQGFFPKYTSGPYQVGNTTMIVSRGLGNSIIPIRIFNRPQIIIVKLIR